MLAQHFLCMTIYLFFHDKISAPFALYSPLPCCETKSYITAISFLKLWQFPCAY